MVMITPRALDLAEFTAEHAVVVAVLQQVLHDAQSDNEYLRQEALEFLRNRPAVMFWTGLIDLDGNVFLTLAQHYLVNRHEKDLPMAEPVTNAGESPA
jgi:hypothetical protein